MRVIVNTDTPDQTAHLAQQIGTHLVPGDCLLLSGPVGAGKTHFARHLIWSLLKTPEDVPSPTFTLVQTYETNKGELWHADLYRIQALDEIDELGLIDAFEQAICLIEWPELLGSLKPPASLDLSIQPDQKNQYARQFTLTATDDRWANLLNELEHGT